MRTIIPAVAAIALGAATLSAPAAAQQEANPYQTSHPIISAPLNIGGAGSFTGVIDPATREMCYGLNAPGLGQPTSAYIRPSAEGSRPVLTLETPVNGASGACTVLPADLARSLTANPSAYTLEVATAMYPNGAVRAQLEG
ncbi:CHRD domain-containing protein [Altericroceibacterium xinjiangense]|uniref:CHRD domain-containing protein n=1 Tax=Altericroceibacterium xinjiangense TaxID=762261 RepID=UPI0013DEBC82|nr:CHRD domain-containing protein [Altericroceibacterium xinjiangense]